MKKVTALAIGTLLILGIVSCHTPHDRSEIEAAMKLYDHLILKLDGDSISRLYASDGQLGNEVRGRDSIKKFLATFTNVNVLSQESVTKSVEISGDSSLQKGSYKQDVVVDHKDTVHIKGDYIAQWIWIAKEQGWRIKKMETIPAK
jgi:hypothetical protein